MALIIETLSTQVLIVGSGISGLYAALKAAERGLDVLLVTKASLSENNSRYAQGGIAAVLPGNPADSIDLHVQDTLKAGAGLCDTSAVLSILSEGYEAVADLLWYGVPFDKTQRAELAVTREAAHSVPRIIHAGGDATGRSVEMTLIGQVEASHSIRTLEYAQVVELLNQGQGTPVQGAVALDLKRQRALYIQTSQVILATGGLGQLYRQTTNPVIATGDGLALAANAGATLQGMEFVQFHPTAFSHQGKVRFLISEALRGEGALLRNQAGDFFAKSYHPDGELAPRDVVTRSIFAEMTKEQGEYVYLDATHLPAKQLEERFPSIRQMALEYGVDLRTDWLPVAPAAHYLMGGLQVDVETAQSSVSGLFAIGETAWTGLHGANRLASNSLLECLVLARRAAQALTSYQGRAHVLTNGASSVSYSFDNQDRDTIQSMTGALQDLMWRHVGVLRTELGLKTAQVQCQQWLQQALMQGWQQQAGLGAEAVNQLRVGLAVIEAALARPCSVGAHYVVQAAEPQEPVLV